MSSRHFLAVALLPATLTLATSVFAADPTGADIFKAKCVNCHSLTPGMSTIAPDLTGVVGRKAGSLPAFNYSTALKGADFVWTTEKLNEWIASPHNVVPETEMSFPGLRDPNERAKVVEFLQSLKAQ